MRRVCKAEEQFSRANTERFGHLCRGAGKVFDQKYWIDVRECSPVKLSIFGSSGLVGRNLSDVIGDWPALPFDKLISRSADLDLLDMKAVDRYFANEKPDVVINLAGRLAES